MGGEYGCFAVGHLILILPHLGNCMILSKIEFSASHQFLRTVNAYGAPMLFSLSSVVRGSESHKMIDLSGNPVLRIYYTSRVSVSCPSPT